VVSDRSGIYPRPVVDTAGSGVLSQAGALLLTETVRVSGLGAGLRLALGRWKRVRAVHDPAKIVADLALTLAVGGDCMADIALLRAEPSVFGIVASDPTVSRTIDVLAGDADRALAAIDRARAAARAVVWAHAASAAPSFDTSIERPLIVDLDATLITAHSEKEGAAPTFKRGFGTHPLCAFVDHQADGTGEPLAIMLRPGNAGSNTAADHIAVVKAALAQLPGHRPGVRPGRKVLVRTDGAGGTHELLDWLTAQRLSYSVGYTLAGPAEAMIRRIPTAAWSAAYDADGAVRDGAFVAELTGLLDLSGWPAGMRVIIRSERPHPGAQLRITDIDGNRITAFATNTRRGQLADLELRHRRRARCEDRIRIAKDTGLNNLPLHDFNQNRIWCAIVMLACELTAWMQMLGYPTATIRRWEPKRLRLRLFSAAGRLARHGRRTVVHLARHGAWSQLLHDGISSLRLLPAPG
jgi:hypothetical protein